VDTKVESDFNHIGHEHRSFRWSLPSNSYVRGNQYSLKNRKTCHRSRLDRIFIAKHTKYRETGEKPNEIFALFRVKK